MRNISADIIPYYDVAGFCKNEEIRISMIFGLIVRFESSVKKRTWRNLTEDKTP